LFISNINEKISQTQNNNRKESRKEGDVIINSTRKNDKKYKISEGEYVDFEEIKE
jgi:ribosome-associated protein YbcJ (S4-like RNA binding protein)